MESLKPGRIYAIVILIVLLGLVISVAGGVVAGGAMAYYWRPVSYTHLTLPTNREV